ncbi:stage V sporulation protein AE [Anoxybacter fermentans]|uniref:Stage V sporulation protein AE n=1 Tax=Anoxybacter fermentans TaxID=1323375 RepID=A0A3Q9HP01_9FIRM|nr:stage V sporulation protein AE [Anoxybacter fermentans]AZR72314.1 stage V sporulation protein AE [Anoxybacter fermentans]
MNPKIRVIIITDGDNIACRAVEEAGRKLNLRTISASKGNPTPLQGEELVALIKQVKKDPVLVMVDDCGNPRLGQGEKILQYLDNHPDIDILGVVAVAANSPNVKGVEVNFSIDQGGNKVKGSVDKYGIPEPEGHRFIEGDTVDILNGMDVPIIVGIGDIGKMQADSIENGVYVTTRAILEILNRSGIYEKTTY